MKIKNKDVNNNTLIVGGSGSGMTRSFVMPHILQSLSSYIITDPKGEVRQNISEDNLVSNTALENGGENSK